MSLNMIAASSRVEFAANVSEELVTEVSPLIASGRNRNSQDTTRAPGTARSSSNNQMRLGHAASRLFTGSFAWRLHGTVGRCDFPYGVHLMSDRRNHFVSLAAELAADF